MWIFPRKEAQKTPQKKSPEKFSGKFGQKIFLDNFRGMRSAAKIVFPPEIVIMTSLDKLKAEFSLSPCYTTLRRPSKGLSATRV